jgi:hypothetical protein
MPLPCSELHRGSNKPHSVKFIVSSSALLKHLQSGKQTLFGPRVALLKFVSNVPKSTC